MTHQRRTGIEKQILVHIESGVTDTDALVEATGGNRNTIRKLRSEWMRGLIGTRACVRERSEQKHDVQAWMASAQEPPLPAPEAIGERRDAYPVMDGDKWIVAGDVHAVTHHQLFLQRMTEFGRKHGVKRLAIVGDLFNGDVDSVHDPRGDEVSRTREFEKVAELLSYLLQVFEHIELTPGNHLRKRFVRTLRGDISPPQIVRLLTNGDDHKRITLHNHDALHFVSGGVRWFAMHQYQFRKVKLSLANSMAQKYQCNVILFHQHHTAIGRDEFDRYTTIDCGGLHDHRLMSYVHTVPSARGIPNNGFVYLNNGTGNLLTPYSTMTDWRAWGFAPMDNQEAVR